MRAFVFVALTAPFIVTSASGAERNWVDRYLGAHGVCRQPAILSMAPFGKPAEEWTEADLADVKAAFDRCDALPEAESGMSRSWTGQVLASLTDIVREQRRIAAQKADALEAERDSAATAERSRQRRIAADKQASADRVAALQRAAEQVEAERKAAEEHTAALREELKAAAHLADAREAKAKAAQAEARARYGVEAAQQRAVQAEAQAHDAEKRARAEREAADKRIAEAQTSAVSRANKAPATKTPEERMALPIKPPEHKMAAADPAEESATVPANTIENYIACKALSDLVTASRALARNDGDVGAALVNAGECALIPKGTSVRVKAADANGADPKVACVFIEGHSPCLWMPTTSIESEN